MNKYLRRQLGLKKAVRLASLYRSWSYERRNPDDEFFQRDIQRLYKTRVPCSCWMCGHQRESFGKTHQEILADIDWQEQVRTVFTTLEPER